MRGLAALRVLNTFIDSELSTLRANVVPLSTATLCVKSSSGRKPPCRTAPNLEVVVAAGLAQVRGVTPVQNASVPDHFVAKIAPNNHMDVLALPSLLGLSRGAMRVASVYVVDP